MNSQSVTSIYYYFAMLDALNVSARFCCQKNAGLLIYFMLANPVACDTGLC